MPVGYTSQRSVQVSGFTDICLLPRCAASYPLPVRQASALPSASSGFAVARDTLAVRLALLLAECAEDFHLQVRAPCRAHKQKRGAEAPRVLHCTGQTSLVVVGIAAARRLRELVLELRRCWQVEVDVLRRDRFQEPLLIDRRDRAARVELRGSVIGDLLESRIVLAQHDAVWF